MKKLRNSVMMLVGLIASSQSLLAQSKCQELAEQLAEFWIEQFKTKKIIAQKYKKLIEQGDLSEQEMQKKVSQIRLGELLALRKKIAPTIDSLKENEAYIKNHCTEETFEAALVRRCQVEGIPKEVFENRLN